MNMVNRCSNSSPHVSRLGKRKRNKLQASVSLLYTEFMKRRKKSQESHWSSAFHGQGHDLLGILQGHIRFLMHMRERSFIYLAVVISLVLCFMFNVIILYDDLHRMDAMKSRSDDLVKTADYKAPNDLLKMTAMGVKTYNRPECLQELIASVRTFAPYLPIIVADDSDQDVQSYWQTGDQGDVNIRLPTDSGVGYGRNRIVQAIHAAGYKYLIMADDDFKLTSGETIPMLAKYLHETDADVVAATRCDHNMDNCQRSKGLLVVTNNTLTVVPNVTSYPSYPTAPSCYRSDLVQQFFMGKTERLMRVHWDDKLKNNDHYDFLLNAKANNLTLVTCSDVLIFHEKSCENRSIHGEAYTTKRERRWYELLKYLMRKWKLTTIHDEVGKTLILNSNGTGRASLPYTNKYSIKSVETRLYSESVAQALNSDIAAWTWLRPIFDKQTWVIKRTVNPCSFLISGSLHVEFDRYKTFKNTQSVSRYQMYMYEEKCSFAESLWRLKSYGKVATDAHVYYVTAVSNDNSYLKRLLHILDNDINKDKMSLIIVLMDATFRGVVEANTKTINYEVVIIDQGPPFSRSIGLKAGFNKAIQLAYERKQHNAIGFSIDTSIIPPKNFTAQIRHSTICGSSAFVPIVFKCMSCLKGDLNNQTDGYWVYTGFGMVGLCLSDYVTIGGWSTVWGYRWGGEDVDIMERIAGTIPHVVRSKEPNYIYVRNPTVKDKNPAYYTKRNLYPKPLPPSSLTTSSFKEDINLRLLNFIKESTNFLDHTFRVLSVKKTYTDHGKGMDYYVLLTNQLNQTYWFIVHSFLSPLL